MTRNRFALALPLAAALFSAVQAQAGETIVDAGARTALGLTLYQGNLALVDERRRVMFTGGPATLAFDHVSRALDAASVSIDAGAGSRVTAVSLQADLLTPDNLLNRSLGRRIGVVKTHPTTGAETVVEAEVLSVAGGLVLKIGDRIETGRPGRLVFFNQPADLRPRPALLADISGAAEGPRQVRLAYLSGGMGWRANYTIELAPDGDRLDLAARAALHNSSGVAFENATVRLVAGDVRRQAPRRALMRAAKAGMQDAAEMAASPGPGREQLESFHLYTLPQPITLRDRETKQVALLSADSVEVQRQLVSRAAPAVHGTQRGTPPPSHPETRLRFLNARADRQPLPGGLARIYAHDTTGNLQFIGEDRVRNTPVGGAVTLTMGRAFDVRVKRTQTAFQRIGNRVTETAYRIELENGGDEVADVRVEETIPGDWRVIEESGHHAREGAAAVWRVTVPAKGKADMDYRVRVER